MAASAASPPASAAARTEAAELPAVPGGAQCAPPEDGGGVRTWGKDNTDTCTDLVHWCHALGDTRNQIVHEGSAVSLEYAPGGSAYEGPLVNIGERLLRETVRVCLRDFGFDDLWKPPTFRALKQAFEDSGGFRSLVGQ